jgi:hypothetical protein
MISGKGRVEMAHLVLTIVLAAIAAFSGVGKLRRDPRIVQAVHEVVGGPLQYFSAFGSL